MAIKRVVPGLFSDRDPDQYDPPIRMVMDEKSKKEIERLSREFKKVGDGKTIPREFRKTLGLAVKPVVSDLRQVVRNLPSKNKSRGAQGLRRRIAREVKSQVKTSGDPRVAVGVKRKGLGPQQNLPRLMNQGMWRHPVFGDRSVWVEQRSQAGWFDESVKRHERDVGKALEDTINVFERRL